MGRENEASITPRFEARYAAADRNVQLGFLIAAMSFLTVTVPDHMASAQRAVAH